MNDKEKEAVKFFYNLRATIDESNMLFDEEINVKHGKETIKQITTILNLIEKLQKEKEELKNQEATQRKINELDGVRPEELTGEARRLFEAIMKIADERDDLRIKLKEKNKGINSLMQSRKKWKNRYYKIKDKLKIYN